MNVTVFGATGAIGQFVASELLAAGHTVTAYARNPAKVPSTWPDDVRLVIEKSPTRRPSTRRSPRGGRHG